jgi:hypothetical protein
VQRRQVLAHVMEHDGKNGETTQDIKLRKITGKLHGARITDDSCLNQSVSSTIFKSCRFAPHRHGASIRHSHFCA